MKEDNNTFSLFSNYGTVSGFKFLDKEQHMALIQMSSVEEACEALIVSTDKRC